MLFGEATFTTNHNAEGISTIFQALLNFLAIILPITTSEISPKNLLPQCSYPFFQIDTVWPNHPYSIDNSATSQVNATKNIVAKNLIVLIRWKRLIRASIEPRKMPDIRCWTDHISSTALSRSPKIRGRHFCCVTLT